MYKDQDPNSEKRGNKGCINRRKWKKIISVNNGHVRGWNYG